jgi:hypothetical protein
MLADGIYNVQFDTLVGQGDGIVVVAGDTIRGGDASFVYYGKVEHSENGFIARIETRRHSQGRASVFNMDSVHIHLIGKSEGLDAICTGTAIEVPGLIFKAVLKFVHE